MLRDSNVSSLPFNFYFHKICSSTILIWYYYDTCAFICWLCFPLLIFWTEFISYARGIFESNLEDVSSEMPLESDARAYEFLASYNNDVERAKFFLHSTLSFGKGNDSSLSPYHLKRLSWNIFTIFNKNICIK